MARRLDQATAWLGFPEGLVGLVTAIGADVPEVTSAITGIMAGHHDLGLGVIFGSNIFNLAALLGVSAIIGGRIVVSRPGILLNGIITVWITAVIAVQVIGVLLPLISGILIAVVVVPYVALLSIEPKQVADMPLPSAAKGWLGRALGETREDCKRDEAPRSPSNIDLLALVPLVVMVILASVGLVHSALAIGEHFEISKTVIGTLVLAPLTGLPNLVAAIGLARKGRGRAVVVEAVNSNSINLVAGVLLPSAIVGLGKMSGQSSLSLWWMMAMTVGTIGWCSRSRGLAGIGGAGLIAVYIAFMIVILLV